MKTLFINYSFHRTPLYIPTLPPPWNPTMSFLPLKTIKNDPHIPNKTWKIHAKPRGFTGANTGKPKVIRDRTASDADESSFSKGGKKGSKEEEEEDEKIPDVVMQRMIGRILFNVGVPLVIGLAMLQGFSVVKEQNLWQVPRWLPFLTTFFTFGASALGIAYGTLSTSWDENSKGSILGFEEAKKNWVEIWKEEDAEKTAR